MKLSIIIPTYNEEDYLPRLLRSIKEQNYEDYEVIIADNNSLDKTVDIAKEYNCKVVQGGLPAVGRNNGAKVANGEILIFLDSDLMLTRNYLTDMINEFEEEELGIGITQMTPLSEKRSDIILHDLANWFMIAVEKIKPHGAGCYGIIVKKSLHDSLGGFDETLDFGEDSEYIERIASISKFKVLRNPKIGVSTRRLEEEGLYNLLKVYGKSTINDFRGRRTSASELNYEFNHDPLTPLEKENLDKIAETSNKNKEHTLNIKQNIDEEESPIEPSKRKLTSNKRKIIFYSVCGEGMGHAVRSAVVIDELKKNHEVYVFSSNRAYEYLNSKFDNVYEIGGFNTVYENNKVRSKKTLFKAVKTNPTNLKEGYDVLFKKSKEVKPNIIISDFENYSSMLSKLINVPLISIGNIHIITQTRYDYPPFHKKDRLFAKAVTKAYIIRPVKHILTSFFTPPLKNEKKSVIYPPIIRNEIMELKSESHDYILIYQTSDSSIKLMDKLKESDEKFIVYGFNKELVDENLTYRKFNEDIFYEDMRCAKAIITNGGFTMISEAIYLKKPVYSIPAEGNFEQILNGYYVEKLGYGEYHDQLNSKLISSFINNLEEYETNLNNNKNSDNSAIFKELEEDIQKYSKDY